MDLMRKFINSPLVRRRGHSVAETVTSPVNDDIEPLGNAESRKYFGQPLDKIIERDQTPVPALVTKSCECICRKGRPSVFNPQPLHRNCLSFTHVA